MHLTSEEEKILDGELGWAYQVSMRILTRLGELFEAKRLIPIDSAHISGVSYKTIGNAAIDFLQSMVKGGGKVKVASTTNPSVFDSYRREETALPRDVLEKQMRIINLYRDMEVSPTLTCTPYYLSRPTGGSHLAWSESSAVVYANSILRAWTNREGGPGALAAAMIGKVPDYGLHQPENRRPDVLVEVEPKLNKEIEFGAMGICLGKILGDRVPVFSGLDDCAETNLKQLGAALASSGMTSIFHRSLKMETKGFEKVTVEEKDLKNAIEDLSTTSDRPDLVFVGCPHCSLTEIRQISRTLEGKKVKKDAKLWVCTSRHMKSKARKYVDKIESAGGKVLCDTCVVVTWVDKLGVDALMTNSAKTAYYAPTFNRVQTVFKTLEECVAAACEH